MAKHLLHAEPPVATGLLAPAVVVGAAMLFAHLVAGAMLSAIAVTFSPGPGTAGGAYDVAVWLLAVAVAAVAARPILRRVGRPVAVGALGGVLVAAAYSAIATGFTEPGAVTGYLPARAGSLALAGLAVGVATWRWPGGGGPDEEVDASGRPG